MAESSCLARYLAEFIGTFLLVFTVGCNIHTGSPTWGVTSIACILMVMIYALGGVSGANFNPAVSVSLGLCGKTGWCDVWVYCLVQCSAGVAAGVSCALFLQQPLDFKPGDGFGWWEVMLAEMLYTCMLCFVVLNVAASKRSGCDTGHEFYGIAIGFVVVAGGYAAGHVSGGVLNPAVALGLDIGNAIPSGIFWGPIYCLYQLGGAVLAVAMFRLVRPDDFDDAEPYVWTHATYWTMKLAAEFIGTFYLVLTVGLNVLGRSPAPAFSIGAALMVMVFSLASCSSAHFNPAVTLAVLLSGRGLTSVMESAAYMVAQFCGGICAAFVYTAMEHGNSFLLGPGKGYGWISMGVAEAVYTALLCFVVLSVATVSDEKKLKQFFGLAIGSCVTAGGYAIGAVSGGSLNPAVSVGVAASHALGGGLFYEGLIYTAIEFAGACGAAILFKVTRPSEYPLRKIELP